MAAGKRSLSFEELMQATPNYPPYAMEVVGERGGEAVFGGNISAAMLASFNADIVLACDINMNVVAFYKHLIDEMKKTPSVEDFSRHFGEKIETYMDAGVYVSSGPLSFLPFLFDQGVYDLVRSNVEKLQIHHGDFTNFIGWLRDEKHAASVIDANNIPEYVADWRKLFGNPPLEDGGIFMFGKRDGRAYAMPDGSISPGSLKKSIAGHSSNAPEGTIKAIPVIDALASFGYVPVSMPIISNVIERNNGALTYKVTRSTEGVRNIMILEEIRGSDSVTGKPTRVSHGGNHFLYTLQYHPAEPATNASQLSVHNLSPS